MQEDDLEPAVTTFGKVLRQLRRDKELTQAQLAEKVGTSQQNIQGIEAGKSAPGNEIYERMLDFFGHDSLLSSVPPKQPPAFMRKPVYYRTSEGVTHLVTENTPPLPRSRPLLRAAQISEDIGIQLPEGLRGGLNAKLTTQWSEVPYRVDYLGRNICLEIKSPQTPLTFLSAARSGLQQLYLFGLHFRAHYALLGETPPELVLAILSPEFDPLQRGARTLSRGEVILREARLMGISVFFPKTVEKIAQAIVARETGQHFAPDNELNNDGEELETDD